MENLQSLSDCKLHGLSDSEWRFLENDRKIPEKSENIVGKFSGKIRKNAVFWDLQKI